MRRVKTHEAIGLGCYCVFSNPSVKVFNAVEAPSGPEIKMVNMLMLHLVGNEITHVINGIGNAANAGSRVQRVLAYP
jgi:hypothetical protein